MKVARGMIQYLHPRATLTFNASSQTRLSASLSEASQGSKEMGKFWGGAAEHLSHLGNSKRSQIRRYAPSSRYAIRLVRAVEPILSIAFPISTVNTRDWLARQCSTEEGLPF